MKVLLFLLIAGRHWTFATAWLILTVLFGLPVAVYADTLILKNGRQVIGVIDSASSDEKKVTIRTSLGTIQIPRGNIERTIQEQGISTTESSGDLALSENKLERALDLYEAALQKEPDNARLKKKADNAREMIARRDETFYAGTFDQIRQSITAGQFENAIGQGENLLARLRVETAREKCRQLLAEAHIGLARKYRDTVNFTEAENHYAMAAQIDPRNPVTQLEMAEMLQNLPGRKSEAIPLYLKGIEFAAQSGGARADAAKLLNAKFQLGKLYRDERQFDKAAETLLEVMQQDHSYQFPQAADLAVDAYSKIPAGALAGANVDRIISNLQSIVRLKPAETRAYLLLGRIYFDQKDWNRARENFEAALRNASADTSARQETLASLGLTYHKLGDLNGAAQKLQALLDMNAANYDSVAEFAEVKLEQADYPKALELFKRAQDMDKDKYRAYLGMGEVQQKLAQYQLARDNYNAVVAKDPTNARAQMNIAQSYFQEERWDDAINEIQKAIQVLGGDEKSTTSKTIVPGTSTSLMLAESLTLMGNANLNTDKANLARENFQMALRQESNYAPALDGIGRTYQHDGLHKDAEAYFDKAIAADPKSPEYYLSMAINWHKFRKEGEKALPYYMKYIELGGKDPNVRVWIKDLGGTPPAG